MRIMVKRLFPVLATLGLALGLAASGTASAQPAAPWTTLLLATFPILADLPGWPVNCTGWYAAPRGQVGSMLVSVYVTAGHCAVPQIVRTAEGLEQMAVLARLTRPGADAAIGARFDSRSVRTFLRFATTPPHPGDRALVAGYSSGHLTEAVLTTLPDCLREFLCFHSDLALRSGMSGAPILSLRTGEIVGVLVAATWGARGHMIMATPSAAVQALLELATQKGVESRRRTGHDDLVLDPLRALVDLSR